ncbi:MAG: hypothetical protein EPN17_12165 [Methylobacter sp.]|nr:MAG: hypothetical protein EPN17_12165 [Methylobacter sp.]
MTHVRRIVGSTEGYSIMFTEELNADRIPVCAWFGVYNPDGMWLNSFSSKVAAEEFVNFKVNERELRRMELLFL